MSISEAESVVMDVLWQEHPLTADEVIAIVDPNDQPTLMDLLANHIIEVGMHSVVSLLDRPLSLPSGSLHLCAGESTRAARPNRSAHERH